MGKYEWDHAGRLRSFRNQAADTSEPTQYVQYLYDAAGQRVKKLNRKQTGANWDAVVYIDGVLELRTQKRGATTKQGLELHVLDGQKRLGRRRSSDSFDSKPDNLLVLGDHLGSAHVELDWSLGSFVDREEFRPYGETSFGSYANKRYRFTGKERDEESGLNYHGARYYSPGLARWMSPDPKGLVDGVNVYGYVRGNPVGYRDPLGTKADATDECIDTSRSAGLNCLREKVLTGSANQSEVKEWQNTNSQLHIPQKHASIRATTPERTITNGTEITVVARSWGGYGRLEPNGHAALIVNVGTKERPDHWIIQGGPAMSVQDGQAKKILRGGMAHAAKVGWHPGFSRTAGLNWLDKQQVLTVPVVSIRSETLQVNLTAQEIKRATELVGQKIKDVTYHPVGPNSNTYVRLIMEELHIDTSSIDSLSKENGLELHRWSTKLQ